MIEPSKGIGWPLSTEICEFDFLQLRKQNLVRALRAGYGELGLFCHYQLFASRCLFETDHDSRPAGGLERGSHGRQKFNPIHHAREIDVRMEGIARIEIGI